MSTVSASDPCRLPARPRPADWFLPPSSLSKTLIDSGLGPAGPTLEEGLNCLVQFRVRTWRKVMNCVVQLCVRPWRRGLNCLVQLYESPWMKGLTVWYSSIKKTLEEGAEMSGTVMRKTPEEGLSCLVQFFF